MTKPFNVEQFRQQMRGQAPAAPQQVPAQIQMQGPSAGVPSPAPQPYRASQMQPQMSPQIAPQQMVPPMPQNPGVQAQPYAQPYSPPTAGQPQAWMPQGQRVPVQQGQAMPVQQMMQTPVYASPPDSEATPQLDEAAPKKPRFSLKRLKKDKAPKVKKTKADKTDDRVSTSKFALRPFLTGLMSGVALTLIGSVLLGSFLTKKTDQKFEAVAAAVAQAEPVTAPALIEAEIEPSDLVPSDN